MTLNIRDTWEISKGVPKIQLVDPNVQLDILQCSNVALCIKEKKSLT